MKSEDIVEDALVKNVLGTVPDGKDIMRQIIDELPRWQRFKFECYMSWEIYDKAFDMILPEYYKRSIPIILEKMRQEDEEVNVWPCLIVGWNENEKSST